MSLVFHTHISHFPPTSYDPALQTQYALPPGMHGAKQGVGGQVRGHGLVHDSHTLPEPHKTTAQGLVTFSAEMNVVQ